MNNTEHLMERICWKYLKKRYSDLANNFVETESTLKSGDHLFLAKNFFIAKIKTLVCLEYAVKM